ncbi:DKNYY domain-containing protein [Klebsiella spallanzanii]|uniref:DKNYY domain-containing protein n=1 Tax=Klebsiella spallanzanii TaxID=2587528 RepID=UPI0011709300|nr:DKNYY domain-containing protein [Klebsiella spallanzanii]VUS37353.1 hypothetical protein SB6419_02595 [Klebsiella spallanzanii]
MKKPRLAFTALLSLAIPLHAAEFHYQQQGEETLYVAQSEPPEIISRLTGIDFAHLQRIADLSQSNETTPLSNINADTSACSTSLNNVPAICDYHHAWLSDSQQILWAGKKVIDADVASFRAFGKFAADKNSLYFDGQRTDDNHGEQQVDMTTLAATEVEGMLKDKRNLYYQGRWLGSADGFRILGWKSWSGYGEREANPLRTRWGVDFIVLTAQQVIVNGVAIAADPPSFQVVRWLPGALLIYRDKNGEHHHTIDNEEQDCSQNFDIQSRQVTWRRRAATERSNCQVETLPGADPERFQRINTTMASSPGLLYQIKPTAAEDKQLSVTALDDPNVILNERTNAGKSHGYFIGRQEVLEVATYGRLATMGKKEPHYGYIFSHDDRYIYAFEPDDTLYRYRMMLPASADIYNTATRKKMDTVEELYDPQEKTWAPSQRNQG